MFTLRVLVAVPALLRNPFISRTEPDGRIYGGGRTAQACRVTIFVPRILLAVGEDLLKKTLRVSPAYSFRARPGP